MSSVFLAWIRRGLTGLFGRTDAPEQPLVRLGQGDFERVYMEVRKNGEWFHISDLGAYLRQEELKRQNTSQSREHVA